MTTEQLLGLIDTLKDAKKSAPSLAHHYDIERKLKLLEAEVEARKKSAFR